MILPRSVVANFSRQFSQQFSSPRHWDNQWHRVESAYGYWNKCDFITKTTEPFWLRCWSLISKNLTFLRKRNNKCDRKLSNIEKTFLGCIFHLHPDGALYLVGYYRANSVFLNEIIHAHKFDHSFLALWIKVLYQFAIKYILNILLNFSKFQIN